VKKKAGLIIGVSLCVFILGLGLFQTSATEKSPEMTVEDIKEMVTNQYPGEIQSVKEGSGSQNIIYEIKLKNDTKGYTLKVDGDTGEIINIDEKTIAQADDSSSDEVTISEKDTDKNTDTDADKKKDNQGTDSKSNNDDKNSNGNNETGNKDKNTSENSGDKKDSEQNNEQSNSKNDEGGKKKKSNNQKQDKNTVIDIRGAISIGLKEYQGIVTEIELDTENGQLVYEVEIVSGNEKAELDINAYTGEILLISTQGSDGIEGDTSSFLNIKKIIGNALNEFPGTVVEMELDDDDDSYIYEIEIKSGNTSKEIEVDAYTGDVIDID